MVLSSWERGPQDIVVATPNLTTQYCGTSPQFDSTVTTYPDLTEVLLGRGHSEADIEKILRENFLRVLQAVTGS